MKSVLLEIPLPLFLQNLGLPQALPIFGYGLMILLAYMSVMFLAIQRAKSRGVSSAAVQDTMVWALIAGLVGARFMHFLLYPQYYNHFGDFLKVYEGGLVLYGSFFTAPLAIWLNLKKHGVSWEKFFAIFLPLIPLGIGIGRLGCFLNGCCYGVVSNHAWCVSFPHDSLYVGYQGHLVHPVQIYAFLMGASLSAFMLIAEKVKGEFSAKNLVGVFLVGYALIRLIEESFRDDTPAVAFNRLTAGQITSLLLILLVAMIMMVLKLRPSK